MPDQLRVSRLRRSGGAAQDVCAIGVDNGGTWIRLKGLNARGRCVWSLKKPSPTVKKLPAFLKKHLKRFHKNLCCLAVGSRGVWKQAKRRALTRSLYGLAKKIVVMSDVEAAWLAAFKNQGIIVISGTGSIAYGRRQNGAFARAGGLGPDKGDEGSGFWIGKEWLRRTGQNPGTKSVRQIAALAPSVLKMARTKNAVAAGIVQDAQQELAGLVKTLARRLNMNTVPVSWAGSVLENAVFRRGFAGALAPLRIQLVPPRKAAAEALARSIMSHAHR